MLQILDTGVNSPEANMEIDEKLLINLDPQGDPILHFYQWSGPAVTYGYFIDPAKYLDLQKFRARRILLARRPTGGGIVFHIWDLAFSFLMPAEHVGFSGNTLENYRFVNCIVLETMKKYLHMESTPTLVEREHRAHKGIYSNNLKNRFSDCAKPRELSRGTKTDFSGCSGTTSSDAEGITLRAHGDLAPSFCMARPTIYDVVHEGKKIAGAAQRRRKNGYLHQGTISLAVPQRELLEDLLLVDENLLQSMEACSFAPLGRYWKPEELCKARSEIQKLLVENFRANV